jgi:hypothetical protein
MSWRWTAASALIIKTEWVYLLADLGKQAGANQRSDVARINRLDGLLAGELVDLPGHPASNLCGTISAVEHLDSGRVCCTIPD